MTKEWNAVLKIQKGVSAKQNALSVKWNDVLENGYFAKGSVWIFEIRYEFDADSNGYKFKLFIESADSTRNGVYKNYYKIG